MAYGNVVPFVPQYGPATYGGNMPTPSREALAWGRELTSFCSQNDYNKAQWNAWADITERYYRGDMWSYLIRQALQIWSDPRLISGPFDNSYGIALDIQNSTIMGVKMEPECIPIDNDMHSRKSANAGTAILRDHYERNQVATNLSVRSLMLLLNGLRFVRVGYDENQLGTITFPVNDGTPNFPGKAEAQITEWERRAGLPALTAERLPDGRIRATYMMGGTVEHDVHGGSILVDPGVDNWADVTRFAVVEYPSVFATRQKYDVPPQTIQPVYVNDNRNYGQFVYNGPYQFYQQDSNTGHRFSPRSNLTRTVEYWQRMKNGLWDRMLCTGANNEYVLSEAHNVIANPYVCYTAQYGDSMYRLSKPRAQAMIDPQYLCNSYLNFRLRYFQKCPKDVIWVEDSSDDATGDFTGDFVQRKNYSSLSGKVPVISRFDPTTLRTVAEEQRQYSADVYAAAGVSPAQRGFAGDRQSGDALQVQIQSSDAPLMFIRGQIVAAEERKNRLVLQVAQQFYSMPRYLGVGVESGAREFAGTDIRGGTTIRMRLTGTSAETQAERATEMQAIAGLGLLNPGAEQVLTRYVRGVQGANMDALQPEEQRLSFLEADREYEQMELGNVIQGPPKPGVEMSPDGKKVMTGMRPLVYRDSGVPLIQPTDMDELHIDRHWQQCHDPHCPQPLKAMLTYHINNEHKVRIAQRQQLAQQAQITALADKSVAEAKGPMVNSLASIHAAAEADANKPEEKGTPASGGRKSGDTRAKQAAMAS